MLRRIGFFPIMMATFSVTVSLIGAFDAHAQTVGAASSAAPVDAAATVERVASLLDARYVVPETGKRYAATLRANLRAGRYAGISDPAILGERITADLQAVAPDGHLRVRVRVPGRSVRQPAANPGAPNARPPEIAPGITVARWVAPGVAYIAFSHFSDDPAAVDGLTGILRRFAGARALVIDARDHRGGSFPVMAALCDRLFGQSRRLADLDVSRKVIEENGSPFPVGPDLREAAAPAGLIRFQHWSVPATAEPRLFRVPVYYLTSKRTYSAAEHMAMVLKSSHRATLIGEATGGGNHFGGTEDVGSGLEMFVPIGRTTDPVTGEDWEGRGVQPDRSVPAGDALEIALQMIPRPSRSTDTRR